MQARLLDRAARLAEARRRAGLFGLLARARGRRGSSTAFLAANAGFALDPPTDGELPGFVTPSPEGWMRILPGLLEAEGGLDGFFVARLVRKG